MKVEKDFKNGLLKRREVSFIFNSEKNPGFAGAQKLIADNFKAAEDVIVVKNVMGYFGRNEFLVKGFIYDSKDAREMIEQKKKVKKEVAS